MVSLLKRHRLFLSLLLLSVVIFMGDLLILKSVFIYGDYKLQFFPWSKVYSDSIKQFSFPFWVANMGCGFPLVAEGQIGAFYPLNIIFFFLLPFIAAYNYSIIFHFILGGIFMYLFMRAIGLKGLPAVIPAILFIFSSPYAGCFSNTASLKTLCWFPFVLYLNYIALERVKPRLLLWSGAIMGMQLLAGAVQMAVYAIVFQFLYFISYLFLSRLGLKRSLKYAVYWILGLALALVIFAPQFIISYRLASLSSRALWDIKLATWGSFHYGGLITLIVPYLAVTFRAMVYIGILPLLFAGASIFDIKNSQVKIFWIVFTLATILSFGNYTPVYPLILKITHLYSFRTPSKILFFSAFSLIVLSGFGLYWLLNNTNTLKLNLFKIAILVFSVLFISMYGFKYIPSTEDLVLKKGNDYIKRNFADAALRDESILKYYQLKLEDFATVSSDAAVAGIPSFIIEPLRKNKQND